MAIHKILLVEDSPEVRLLVSAILGSQYQLTISDSVKETKELILKNEFDLIILDIELTDGDGYQVCTWIKGQPETLDIPVVFLTNRSTPTDKVLGFSIGADDYIAKPIEPLEFKARVDTRIKANDRRKNRIESFTVGPFRVEIATSTIYMNTDGSGEKSLDLTHKEYKLLVYFLQNKNLTLSRQQILDKVWERSINVTDRTVDSHVHAIRKKIGRFSSQIESVPKEGYRYRIDASSKAA